MFLCQYCFCFTLLSPLKYLSKIFKARKASRSQISIVCPLYSLANLASLAPLCHRSLNLLLSTVLPITTVLFFHSALSSLALLQTYAVLLTSIFPINSFQNLLPNSAKLQSSLSTRPVLFWQFPQETGSIKDMFTFELTSSFTGVAQI